MERYRLEGPDPRHPSHWYGPNVLLETRVLGEDERIRLETSAKEADAKFRKAKREFVVGSTLCPLLVTIGLIFWRQIPSPLVAGLVASPLSILWYWQVMRAHSTVAGSVLKGLESETVEDFYCFVVVEDEDGDDDDDEGQSITFPDGHESAWFYSFSRLSKSGATFYDDGQTCQLTGSVTPVLVAPGPSPEETGSFPLHQELDAHGAMRQVRPLDRYELEELNRFAARNLGVSAFAVISAVVIVTLACALSISSIVIGTYAFLAITFVVIGLAKWFGLFPLIVASQLRTAMREDAKMGSVDVYEEGPLVQEILPCTGFVWRENAKPASWRRFPTTYWEFRYPLHRYQSLKRRTATASKRPKTPPHKLR